MTMKPNTEMDTMMFFDGCMMASLMLGEWFE